MLRRIESVEQVMRRQDLGEADVTCLMCGRLIGQVAGLVSRGVREERNLPSAPRWSSFRAANADRPTMLFTGRERFRCQACGGFAVMEAFSISVIRESVAVDNPCPIHRDRMQGRGRRPRGCRCHEVQAAA
jgi:hypothetical protein